MKISNEFYILITKKLYVLDAGIIPDTEFGICGNLEIMFTKLGTEAVKIVRLFIHESFTEIYGANISSTPIEGDLITYLRNDQKWDKETKFGLLRFELVDKMIAYAEDKLKEEV